MEHKNVFGLVGPSCKGQARKIWNALLKKEGIDGFFDFYRAKNSYDLVTRLSEMFLLERRGYLLDESLQESAAELMDMLTAEAKHAGRIDTVKNERGVLIGYFLDKADPEAILKVWMT